MGITLLFIVNSMKNYSFSLPLGHNGRYAKQTSFDHVEVTFWLNSKKHVYEGFFNFVSNHVICLSACFNVDFDTNNISTIQDRLTIHLCNSLQYYVDFYVRGYHSIDKRIIVDTFEYMCKSPKIEYKQLTIPFSYD